MKKLLYYLIICLTFVILLFFGSFIVTFLFNDPGDFILILMCAVVLSIFKVIQSIIKKKMKV